MRGISKRERIALKTYIDDIYSVNGAVFLSVSNRKKVKKALDTRRFKYIIPRYYNIIVLPYHEGVRLSRVYYDYIEEYINPNFKPALYDDINQLIDFTEFKNFIMTMIIRKRTNYFSLQNKSIIFMVSLLLSRMGLETAINLRHNQVKFYGNGADGQIRFDSYFEITSEHYKKYGWLFKVEKLTKDSPLHYTVKKLDKFNIPLFTNIKYTKNDNYITTIDNYESLLNEFQGLQWLSKIYSVSNIKNNCPDKLNLIKIESIP